MAIENEGIEIWLEKLLAAKDSVFLPEDGEDEDTAIATATAHLRGEHDENEGYTLDANERVIPNTLNCKLCQEREEMYARADFESEYDMHQTVEKYYGKAPYIKWSFNKTKQATVEKKINSLVHRMKAFYLTITNIDDTIEEWYVDGGNWVSELRGGKFSSSVGHVRNLLPFLTGRRLKPRKRLNRITK